MMSFDDSNGTPSPPVTVATKRSWNFVTFSERWVIGPANSRLKWVATEVCGREMERTVTVVLVSTRCWTHCHGESTRKELGTLPTV